MDLRSEAADLYGLSPGRFVEARDARSAKARRAGDKELAAAIKKLKRPAPAAWLANILTRRRGEKVEALVALGARLRDAQQRLAADELRALTRQGRQAVAELVKESAHLATAEDQVPSGAVLRRLEGTLNAALADAEAGAAVLAGQLVAPVSYAGLGATMAGAGTGLGATMAGAGTGPGATVAGAGTGPGATVAGAGTGPGATVAGAKSARPHDDTAKEAAERALAADEKRLAELSSELEDAVQEQERTKDKLEALDREAARLQEKGAAAQARVEELQGAVAGCSARVEMARHQARR